MPNIPDSFPQYFNDFIPVSERDPGLTGSRISDYRRSQANHQGLETMNMLRAEACPSRGDEKCTEKQDDSAGDVGEASMLPYNIYT